MEPIVGHMLAARSARGATLVHILAVITLGRAKRSMANGAPPWPLGSLGQARVWNRLRSVARRTRHRRSFVNLDSSSNLGGCRRRSSGSSQECQRREGGGRHSRDDGGAAGGPSRGSGQQCGPAYGGRGTCDEVGADGSNCSDVMITVPSSPSCHPGTLVGTRGGISRPPRRLTVLDDKPSIAVRDAAATAPMRRLDPLAATGGTFDVSLVKRVSAMMNMAHALERRSRRPSGPCRQRGCTCPTRAWARGKT